MIVTDDLKLRARRKQRGRARENCEAEESKGRHYPAKS